jgi:transcriptional regulator with XRE-family HTH domain
MTIILKYDFAGWRRRMGWSREEAAKALGRSRSFYWRIEKTGQAEAVVAWAACGLEACAKNYAAEG